MRGIGVPLRRGLAVVVTALAAVAPPGPVRAAPAGPAPAKNGGLFAPAMAYKAGHYPFEVALGDFHGNGRLDIAAGNDFDNTLSLFAGNGDGTFRRGQTIPVDANPGQLATGDFAGTGHIGLAVAVGAHPVSNTGAVDVLLGNGDGTFQPVRSFAVGASPTGLAAGDLRHGGRLDLVTSNKNDNTVSVLLGNGDGTFQPQRSYPVGRGPSAVALADLHGDGWLDIVATNSRDDTVSVLRGNGDGTFQPQLTYRTGKIPLGVAVGDLNGDGKPDLAVTAAGDNAVSVLLNNGDGTFGAPASYPVGGFPGNVALGDFNLDGRLDIATTSDDAMVSVLVNNGDGTFRPKQAYPVRAFGGRLAVADLNGDGKPDIVAGNDDSVEVLLNIAKRPVTTSLASSVNPSAFGQPVTLTATVCPVLAAPGAPTGTVTFKDGDTALGTGTLAPGGGPGCGRAALTASALAVGTRHLTADYSGDGGHLAGPTAPLTQQVTPARVVTTLTSSADPAALGSPVTFTDTVCPAPPSTGPTVAPTGTVTFADGGTTIGVGTLAPVGGSNCSRTAVSWSHLLPGSHTVTARYSGDADHLPGAAENRPQTIGCDRTVTGRAGSVVAAGGASTCIVDAIVADVVAKPGAALYVGRSTLGSLAARGAAFLGVCGSTATGSVQVADAAGFVVLGDPAEEGCAGNGIHGSVVLSHDHGGAALVGNRIDGTVSVTATSGAGPFPDDAQARIEGNVVGGSLVCTANTPPPTDNGHPNTVTGPRAGQCARL